MNEQHFRKQIKNIIENTIKNIITFDNSSKEEREQLFIVLNQIHTDVLTKLCNNNDNCHIFGLDYIIYLLKKSKSDKTSKSIKMIDRFIKLHESECKELLSNESDSSGASNEEMKEYSEINVFNEIIAFMEMNIGKKITKEMIEELVNEVIIPLT